MSPSLKIRQIGWKLIRLAGLGPLMLRIHPKSALSKLGYWRSFRKRLPVDAVGNPIPWWTYGAIAFLDERIQPSLRVLEFGCGYSTLWLSSRVNKVLSLETDTYWGRIVSSQVGPNVLIVPIHSLKDAAKRLQEDRGQFDIGIIDASINRMGCAELAVQALSERGIVVWDNTDWPEWPQFKDFMGRQGFREISFLGMAAQEVQMSRTTIFYRDQNCLGI